MERKKPFYATPQDAEAAFYDALERADLESMMSVWAEDEEIVCVHPTGPRLAGFAVVQEGWRQIFSGGPKLKVRLSHQVQMQGMLLSVHSVHENITLTGEAQPRPPVVATNVYLRGPLGWRILVHHASPAPPQPPPDAPKTLH
ncbi:MAG TPA: nuclear transport factor 2 family protein [Rhodocyclaceae bacterium]|jgi:ketosteroid isomerase-like protein|nr:nuclear transport factor 2 family protein [Rhodocyclaceae bacterium]